MSEKTEALRLADALKAATEQTDAEDDVIHVARWFVEDADAELRRLHTENERLHQINQSHAMKLSVRGYEIQIADLEAHRDALLEACRAMLTFIERHAPRGLQPEPGSPVAMARTAIAKADGGQ